MADPLNRRCSDAELLRQILHNNPRLTPEEVFEIASLIGYDFDVPEAEAWRQRKQSADPQ